MPSRLFLNFILFATLVFVNGKLYSQATSKQEIDSIYEQVFSRYIPADTLQLISSFLLDSSKAIEYENGVYRSKIIAGFYLLTTKQFDSAQYLLQQCIAYAENRDGFHQSLDHGRALLYSGRASFRLKNYDLSRQQFEQALSIFDFLNNLYYQGSVLNNLGTLHWVKSDYAEALTHYVAGYHLKLENGLGPEKYLSELRNIGDLYARMDNHEGAFEHLHLAKKIAEKVGDRRILTGVLQILGSVHSRLKQYDSAMLYHKESLDLAIALELKESEIATRSNIANMYTRMGQFELSNLEIKTLLRDESTMQMGMLGAVLFVMAKNHFALANYDSSIYYASIPLKEALKTQQKQTVVNLTEILSSSHEKLGNLDSALFYTRYWHAYRDSIYSQENQNAINELFTKIEVHEKESQIRLFEEQRRRSKLVLRVIIGAIITAIIIGYIVFRSFRNRKRVEEEKLILEKEILAKELDKSKSLLSAHTLQMIHKNNGFEEIKSQISDLEGVPKRKINNIINVNNAFEKDWTNFDLYFSQVHEGTLTMLNEKHSNLSITDQRLLALLKLGLTNKEISVLLRIHAPSVKMAKYRLKKKLNLSEKDDLKAYIDKI